MCDVHVAIAVGLANELRVFCESYSRTSGVFGGVDWFEWTWDGGCVLVGLGDGDIFIAHGSDRMNPAIEPFFECDLGHPGLVELVRSAIRR